jgi:hypothetical protein
MTSVNERTGDETIALETELTRDRRDDEKNSRERSVFICEKSDYFPYPAASSQPGRTD